MAITALNSQYYEPPFPNDAVTLPSFSTTQISILNSSYEVAWVFQAPKTGTIDGLMFRTGSVTTGSTIEIRLETVSGGVPSGTLADTNSNITQVIANTDDATVFNITFTGSASVTKGDLLAIRFKNSSGTPATLGIAHFMDAGLLNAPTTIRSTNSGSTWSILAGYAPVCALAYSDGSYPFIAGFFPIDNVFATNLTSATSPNVIGNRFQLPLKSRVIGYWSWHDIDGSAEFKVYDSSGVVTNSTYSNDGDYPFYTSGALALFFLSTPIELEASTDYVVALHKTDTTATQYYSCSVPNIDMMEAMPGGGTHVLTTASSPTDSSDFTDNTTRMAFHGLIIDGIEAASATQTSYVF